MRTKSTTAFALPIFALLGACGGGGSTDIQSTLRFVDRSDVEIARMINAAVGAEIFQAQAQIDQFGDTFDPDPCPTIAISGTTATVTGGCTTLDGVEIQGMAIVTNPIGWDQIEVRFGDDATYEMIGLAFIQAGFALRYDGVIERAGDFTSWDADMTTDSFGVMLRSDLYMSCGGSASSVTCRVSGSGLELIGVGGATVSGTQRVTGQQLITDLTLRGEDTLTVHVENNCIAWSISGSARAQTCP